jgi:anti-sigma-K factor RskA
LSDTTETPSSARVFKRVSTWWRVLAILLLITVLLGWAVGVSMVEQLKAQVVQLQGRLVEVPQVREIAVLHDEHQLPAMLVTFDPKQGVLLVQRLNEVREGRLDIMQLWALTADAAPRSLGVIESKYKTLQMPVTADALRGVTQLAISVENKDGAKEAARPALPYLFQGWLVQKSI